MEASGPGVLDTNPLAVEVTRILWPMTSRHRDEATHHWLVLVEDLRLVIRYCTTDNELWAFLLFPCCEATPTHWDTCERFPHPEEGEGGVALSETELIDLTLPPLEVLEAWLAYADPTLDIFSLTLKTHDVLALLRELDWTHD